jgi:hypothetical protein
VESKDELNKESQPDQGGSGSIKKEKATSSYAKPYISVDKHGENGRLFEEPHYEDGGYVQRGRNNH